VDQGGKEKLEEKNNREAQWSTIFEQPSEWCWTGSNKDAAFSNVWI